jgi:hypothetical protein
LTTERRKRHKGKAPPTIPYIRQNKEGQDMTRKDKARYTTKAKKEQSKTRKEQAKTRKDKEGQGKARKDKARQRKKTCGSLPLLFHKNN